MTIPHTEQEWRAYWANTVREIAERDRRTILDARMDLVRYACNFKRSKHWPCAIDGEGRIV